MKIVVIDPKVIEAGEANKPENKKFFTALATMLTNLKSKQITVYCASPLGPYNGNKITFDPIPPIPAGNNFFNSSLSAYCKDREVPSFLNHLLQTHNNRDNNGNIDSTDDSSEDQAQAQSRVNPQEVLYVHPPGNVDHGFLPGGNIGFEVRYYGMGADGFSKPNADDIAEIEFAAIGSGSRPAPQIQTLCNVM